ncbi:MAG: YiiD C-terminal domain-containing protein [Candidatus Thiodiazotropha sp.]|jgi:thioesterase domain-containing protein
MTPEELEQRIRDGIPLAASMDFRVLSLSATHIRVRGGAEENINVHGTGFAGSLYAIATLAAWGLVRSRLPDGADLVMAEGSIRYRKPVTGDLIAECRIDAPIFETFLSALQTKGKALLDTHCDLPCQSGIGAQFEARLHARLA